ncbi:leukotriene C4 synthase isoform X3 [Felis catus]|uniref:leukotriene C4 synthase isoform X3 n=1 Tax=Felis catus TaxID=9685 RepID=UPI001D19E595|nr:leukotriene C4 synthase isoform X3 [Felis catus]
MKDDVALLATVTLLGVLLQGDLCTQSLPRVAAAHHRPARVRACLQSPSELQRVLPAVPRHALGRRNLLSRRCGGPVRFGLPFRTSPLLSGLRALAAAKGLRWRTPGRRNGRKARASGRTREGVLSLSLIFN